MSLRRRGLRLRLASGVRFNASSREADTAVMREAGKKQLTIGLVIAGVGLAISLGSYVAASSNGGGGYFLMFGLVIVGLMRAFRGYSMMKAAGVTRPATATGVAPAVPAPMPAMPPQPQGDTRSAQAIEHVTPQHASPASPPPPPAPSSMWD